MEWLDKITKVEVRNKIGVSYSRTINKGDLSYKLKDDDTTLVLMVESLTFHVTPFDIKNDGYVNIYMLAIENQSTQGNNANMYVPICNGKANGSFEWGDTPEGFEFWSFVSNKKYDEALKLLNQNKDE